MVKDEITLDKLAQLKSWNRPISVDQAKGDFLYQLYILLHNAPPSVGPWAKQRAFECAADSSASWRVIAISEFALKRIAETGSGEGIQRGHPFSRKGRFEALFDATKPLLMRDEVLRIFFEHDTTVLVTNEENNSEGVDHWSPLYEVPDGLFTSHGFAVYVRKRKDLPWVRTTCSSIATVANANDFQASSPLT